ncbi:MAG: precorrin-6Y C5,15-methyltransferase (decarboxylating) subunit CbiT [Clostridia bacterium]|jgi:cobalt-precorrin-6B (C15)-methyltransferase|nr:precorrin-6Y C5,15-methyltransferase (decarboxylating) subunit CbiT [Clostridia bacterium]
MMKTYEYKGIGIADEAFIRDSAPMTKAEVRAVSVSKLKLQHDDVVVDIGAGTGSVSVECAFLAKRVVAVECVQDSADLIAKNVEKFGLRNVEIVVGMAPKALDIVEKADCVFIGGSKGNLAAIMDWADVVLVNGGRVVANFITLENATEFIRLMGEHGYENIDIAQVQVSKGKAVGGVTMMQANNPVLIISGDKSR